MAEDIDAWWIKLIASPSRRAEYINLMTRRYLRDLDIDYPLDRMGVIDKAHLRFVISDMVRRGNDAGIIDVQEAMAAFGYHPNEREKKRQLKIGERWLRNMREYGVARVRGG